MRDAAVPISIPYSRPPLPPLLSSPLPPLPLPLSLGLGLSLSLSLSFPSPSPWPSPATLSSSDGPSFLAHRSSTVRQPVQIRVLSVFKHWLDGFKDDFYDNPTLCEKLLAFLQRPEVASMPGSMVVRIKEEAIRCVRSAHAAANRVGRVLSPDQCHSHAALGTQRAGRPAAEEASSSAPMPPAVARASTLAARPSIAAGSSAPRPSAAPASRPQRGTAIPEKILVGVDGSGTMHVIRVRCSVPCGARRHRLRTLTIVRAS